MAKKRPRNPRKPNEPANVGRIGILIELRSDPSAAGMLSMQSSLGAAIGSLQLDPAFAPVPMGGDGQSLGTAAGPTGTTIVRAEIDAADQADVERLPGVVKVWRDTEIKPFAATDSATEPLVSPTAAPAGTCPIAPCDCDPPTPKGTIADVANYLRVPQIWARGHRGQGMVVAVVDGGITATGRAVVDAGQPGWPGKLIGNVIGGWPTADWGTTGAAWRWHGNMCATDVLGMAPDARIYDIRISGPGGSPSSISRALAGFQWCIEQFRRNGTPQVITNSWGIFQEEWDATYARDPNHPFTRKVVEALDAGILVLFAAGNCGDTCPDSRCGKDVGRGRSIWGANGHPRVMTVGAVNTREQFIGYSSRGPATLDPNKPDFCSLSHFTGFFHSDSGTSAATPILAGVVALMKQGKPGATQDQIKNCLRRTAKNIGAPGFDHDSGTGIVQAKAAYDCLVGVVPGRLTWPRGRWNDRRTLAVLDRMTVRGLDRITIRGLDDRGTLKQIEDVKLPVRDKLMADRRILPDPGRIGGESPFVLATPHHADLGEVGGDDGAIDAEAQELLQTIELAQHRLAELQLAAEGSGDLGGDDGGDDEPCRCKE